MEQVPGPVVPAHGRDEFVVGAETDPCDGVVVAGEREPDAVGPSVVDADVPSGVAVGWRTGPGEEGQAGAGGVEDVGAETADQAAADARFHSELGLDVQSRDYPFDIFGQHTLVVRVHLPRE